MVVVHKLLQNILRYSCSIVSLSFAAYLSCKKKTFAFLLQNEIWKLRSIGEAFLIKSHLQAFPGFGWRFLMGLLGVKLR